MYLTTLNCKLKNGFFKEQKEEQKMTNTEYNKKGKLNPTISIISKNINEPNTLNKKTLKL